MTDLPFNPKLTPATHTGYREPVQDAAANPGSNESSVDLQSNRAARWIYFFVVFEIVCQLALLVPQVSPIRTPLRVAAFGISAAYLILLPPRPDNRWHPAVGCVLAAIGLLFLGILNPNGGTVIAGVATIIQYTAIAAPLIWMNGLRLKLAHLHNLLMILFVFAALSSLVGTLQTLRPDWTFLQPNLSAVIQNYNDGGDTLKISLASGASVFRPMGLSDMPGGAANSGMTTIVFGFALLAKDNRARSWLLIAPAMALGLYCIYLSQIRSILVMCGVCIIAMTFCMIANREFARISRALFALGIVIAVSTPVAFFIGGETVTDRLSTLVTEDAATVYNTNRGHFLQDTIYNVIPKYPLGAGLGRWGMLNYYFGSKSGAEALWAEIMWTAWAYDGGVPLIIAYTAAVLISIWQAWKISSDPILADARLFGATVFAFNIGALALTFNYPFFMSQGGMDYWILNAALFGAVFTERRERQAQLRRTAPLPTSSQPMPTSILGMHS